MSPHKFEQSEKLGGMSKQTALLAWRIESRSMSLCDSEAGSASTYERSELVTRDRFPSRTKR